jgi:SAM-dependent methyltransferase
MKPMLRTLKRRVSDAIARLLFGPLAPCYDGWTWALSLGRWQAWQQAALPHVDGPRVLEIGCGPGHLLAAIAQAGAQCWGADGSARMLAVAGRNLRRKGVDARLVRCLAQRLPFAGDSFDTVVLCFSGLAWIPEVLAEARRVMAPTGSLVVVDEVFFPRRTPATRFIRRALSLYDCEEEATPTPHDAPLRGAGLIPRIEEHAVRDAVVRLLVAHRGPAAGLVEKHPALGSVILSPPPADEESGLAGPFASLRVTEQDGSSTDPTTRATA